ncbi:UNVERIFIED_CONTAM: hypothetical protein Sindi_0078600 [Sesamum indicum]
MHLCGKFAKCKDEVRRGGLEVEIGEKFHRSHSHSFGEGNGVILAGNDIDLRIGSSSLGLGFRTTEEFERAHEEDETTLDVSAMDDDGVRVSDVREDLPMEKATTTTADDEGGAPADEEEDGDGGQPETEDRRLVSGEQHVFMAEIEKMRLLGGRSKAVSDETDSPTCCHGFSQGNRRFLAGKGDLSNTDLIDSDLGFCAVADSEQTREEDEPTPVVLAMTDEQLMISEGGDTIPVHKASNLAGNEGDKPTLLSTPVTVNRERRWKKHKSKWKRRFGKEVVARCFPTTAPHKAPPIVKRTPWRTLIPAGDGGKTIGNCSGLKMGLLPVKTRLSGDFDDGSASKKMDRGAGSVSELIPARKSEVRPAIARADVERVHDDVAPEIDDAVADAVADCSADVIADEECDVTADADCDVTNDADCDVIADADCDVTADADCDVNKKIENFSNFATNMAPIPLFIGNIPLHANLNMTINDKIAHVFHNSTRKTLSYVAPTVQNGEVIVRPTLDIIRNRSKRWRATAVGYFLGKRPYFHHLKEFAMSVWPGLKEVTGGPWLFQGQPIVLQKWEPGLVLRKLQHTQVTVWIKFRHLPVEFWTEEGLSMVASGVGKPLYPDAITRACTRLDFARVCVMLDVTSNLPKHIIIMNPDEDGGESPCKVDVEYEWLPQKCNSFMTLGHSAKDCVLNKPKPVTPPIAVYVPKVGTLQEPTRPQRNRNHPREDDDTTNIPSRPPHMPDRNNSRPPPASVVGKQREGREYTRDTTGPSREERAIWNVRGLNKRDHQLAVKDIVAEFRLQFLGLLETRVRINNAAQIQSFLLPQWKWHVDYGSSGNCVWIAWNDSFIDVAVVECGTQFIHCLVTIRAIHESIAVTVAYGATEVVDRRELWNALENLAIQCADIPWMIGGDFNAVRDLSEVCGTSGDIRTAMEDFNAAIHNTGLLPLPMQGEWYTWYNHRATPQNLWKKLDRMLINDRWMARFPNAFYSVLTPRTSDHSPMVLYGDRQQQYGGMFRFDNYLARSPKFIPSVQNIWQHNIIGTPMYAVTRKLKALKPIFREQRRNKGDLSHTVQMTKGFLEAAQLLVSSSRRDELYIQLEHCCRLVLAKATKLEQIMLQQRAKIQWMKGGDQCSRVFFRKIAQRRSSRRIFQINDDQGSTHTNPEEVINEFVTYYQSLLGGDRRRTAIDIRFLRPWARHILSNEESTALLLPFTPADVKQAVFDIDEDKAPGPDRYSSGFFKAAWPIVGQEVTSAVLDFFSTGRLLKQINTTLLVLIPKVHPPVTSRLAPRCALKVDIRKAYDTVDWDFLRAVMEMFGFAITFVKWIEECVTTPSFSVGLNGKPHGFFRGARGLRQGDSLSPYLFVLVMEVLHLGFLQLIDQEEIFSYHWKCEAARIFQLGFADDVILFCRADMNSLRIFKAGLDRFAEWSGLRLNVQKSHLIISRSAQALREEMLALLGFQEGALPMRYLGLPLISSRLTIADCRPLLLKIDKRIAGWEGTTISYTGRVQIIKSVLIALSLYWASAFILPKKIINEIEKRLRAFLWKETTNSGYAKVAWKDICRPKEEGGLGFKNISTLNRALMTKKLCDVIRCDKTSIWVEWLYQGRLQHTSIWTITNHGGSLGWRKILRLRMFLRTMVDYRIGDGRNFFLWQDPWHHLGPLCDSFPRGPRLLGLDESSRLSTVIHEGVWQWPLITDLECLEITHVLPTIFGGEDV